MIDRIINHSLFRYLSVGILNTIIGFSVTFLLFYYTEAPIISNSLGYFIGMIFSFYLNKNFSFKSNGPFELKLFIKFIFSLLLAYFLNVSVLAILIYKFQINFYLSHILSSAVYVSVSYYLIKSFVFK